ncbi:beta-galactosidase [Xylariales sp. PMI_506]|nr:beta-galactosidase [Xylariales sp. PMI_506]
MELRSFLVSIIAWLGLFHQVFSQSTGSDKLGFGIKPYKRAALQDIVTWDEYSLFVNGDRIVFFSGEFHPFRLPVPDLWLDVFQKIRSLGFTGVSFYIDWNLLEGKPGTFSAEGVFDLEPFFEAASKAGIYLLARPGPYINAEASGGGFPGWLQRVPAILRTNDTAYLEATELYVSSIGAILAKAQITNGGPIILLQPENEYTVFQDGEVFNPEYMEYVEEQYRNAGIVVPFINNDASPDGHDAPGTPAPVDIYGHDGYPLGFNCASPSTWPNGVLPTNWRQLHLQQSPTTPYSVVEFQGGSFDPWGGASYELCAALVNHEFERVFYKNIFSFGATIMNFYMTYGGTNWGNLGVASDYTSYDYGSAISEDRTITREKYSEAKLEANFLAASPAYLTAVPGAPSTTLYTDSTALYVTPLLSNKTQFFVVRAGELTIPQLSGSLSLNGRDSKIHVTDYDLGGVNLLYSTAEIFTWQKYSTRTVLVVYGGPGEQHELAVVLDSSAAPQVTAPDTITVNTTDSNVILNWETSSEDRWVEIGDLVIYILDRNSAYNFWVVPLPGEHGSLYTQTQESNLIVKAGYLVRSATVSGNTLSITGDLNATQPLWVVGGQPDKLKTINFNGANVKFTVDDSGAAVSTLKYTEPKVNLPTLTDLQWYYVDSLPEIKNGYDDSRWTAASHETTNNTYLTLDTPTSLYSSDYGYHTGALLYRGTFVATGDETSITLLTQGGPAFGSSLYLNGTYLGSFNGSTITESANTTYTLPSLTASQTYVFTVLVDTTGLDENWYVGANAMKAPRGILDYDLSGRPQDAITWKLTGNLGGESYADHARGPLNEGGLWAERQGYHQPKPPVSSWQKSSGPTAGLEADGVGLFVASFDLDIPKGYDIPIAVQLTDDDEAGAAYRIQLFINGWQYGKYIPYVGPQTVFPVPEGILNYHGENWIAVTFWSMEEAGAKLGNIELVAGKAIQSGRGAVSVVSSPSWTKRAGAY